MNRRLVAHDVAETLFKAEDAIDAALAQVAHLAGMLPAARTKANLSAVVGQSVFNRSSKVYAALVQAREEMVGMHSDLDDVRGQIGLRHVAIGGMDKPPEPAVEPAGTLRVVG